MLQANLIGHIGGDAEVKVADGREFTTFRVAHTERWTDESGTIHESTMWVDCVMNGRPNVFQYLKRGTMVYVTGGIKTRVYSSAKDRCMKAGLTISVRSLELLGGKSDLVPSSIVDGNGNVHSVSKHYYCPDFVRDMTEPDKIEVHNTRGTELYIVDRNGFITPHLNESNGNNEKTTDPIF